MTSLFVSQTSPNLSTPLQRLQPIAPQNVHVASAPLAPSALPRDSFENIRKGKEPVRHLTLHPNKAVTIHVDEREVLSMMWRGFSKASTPAAKQSWFSQHLAARHLRTYVKNVLAEGNTDAVKSQVGKVHMVLPREAEELKTRPSHWPFTRGEPKALKSPPQAKDESQAAHVWAQLGHAIEKETGTLKPQTETRKTRNAESLVSAWIDRAEGYLDLQPHEAGVSPPTQGKLRHHLESLRKKWAA